MYSVTLKFDTLEDAAWVAHQAQYAKELKQKGRVIFGGPASILLHGIANHAELETSFTAEQGRAQRSGTPAP